ncbi:hypothetical protein [Actinomycetospora sp. NBRC 106375]|uniref:hypothetical protein n=1 Tax=Actinomycetospora sp. NBRC 106375 TaxID=3032207 RepID=UPI0025559EFE|nr:hypothetical protein [Actinomycetospora sp. NBRC 106375]
MWRDDLGSGAASGGAGGWRLDAYGTWVWDEPSVLERPGAGTDALRRAAGSAGTRGTGVVRRQRPARGARPGAGDRAIAALGDDPTPIFHELTEDRSRPAPRVHVPEPHPGSGPLPVQDPTAASRRGGLDAVPTVPPPALDGSSSAGLGTGARDTAESPEDELRRRAERRRRPLGDGREADREGGRHTWRREEVRTGRHALRR